MMIKIDSLGIKKHTKNNDPSREDHDINVGNIIKKTSTKSSSYLVNRNLQILVSGLSTNKHSRAANRKII